MNDEQMERVEQIEQELVEIDNELVMRRMQRPISIIPIDVAAEIRRRREQFLMLRQDALLDELREMVAP